MENRYGIMTPKGWRMFCGTIETWPDQELAQRNCQPLDEVVKIEDTGFFKSHDELRGDRHDKP